MLSNSDGDIKPKCVISSLAFIHGMKPWRTRNISRLTWPKTDLEDDTPSTHSQILEHSQIETKQTLTHFGTRTNTKQTFTHYGTLTPDDSELDSQFQWESNAMMRHIIPGIHTWHDIETHQEPTLTDTPNEPSHIFGKQTDINQTNLHTRRDTNKCQTKQTNSHFGTLTNTNNKQTFPHFGTITEKKKGKNK